MTARQIQNLFERKTKKTSSLNLKKLGNEQTKRENNERRQRKENYELKEKKVRSKEL